MLQSEKKSNPNQLIGFLLIGLLFMGYLYWSGQKQKELDEQNKTAVQKIPEKDSLSNSGVKPVEKVVNQDTVMAMIDTLTNTTQEKSVSKSNDKIHAKFSNKGAQIAALELLEYKKYNKDSLKHSDPLYLMNESSSFNLNLKTQSGREYNTKDLVFEVHESQKDSSQVVTFSTPLEGGTLHLEYIISPNYQVDLNITSQAIPFAAAPRMEFDQKAFQLEKGRNQEQYYTDLHYSYDNYEENSYETKHLDEPDETLNWFCIKQQFFLSILESESGFTKSLGQVSVQEEIDEVNHPHLKDFKISADLPLNSNINEHLTWYFLPMDMDLLSQEKYEEKGFDDLVPFDYFNSGIIGWLNKHFFYNIYNIMHQWGLASGWIILLMTIIVKLLLSPVMYKQHKSSAMMRAIKPDIDKINEKYKDDPLKKQQETMALQGKAGVNMLSGCIPALLQIPLFMALFRLFPNIIQMRGESFLWANDLTAYDSIYEWETYIPVLSSIYGNHISLFTLLYAVVLILYTRMNSSNIQQPTQEGMPDMRKIMYIMPLLFVFFLNSYASGLTWYYVVSNTINIFTILFIKHYMIDEEKIHALVQENVKKAPKKKKKSKFQQLLDQAAEQQKLQEAQKKKKK